MKQERRERFEQVAAAELAPLRRFALSICRDPHQADDLVQSALERMFLSWSRVEQVSRADAYLRTTVVRLMLNERRRPWHRRERPVDSLPERGYSYTAAAVVGMDLTQALAGLTVKQRAIVVMRYVEDRSVAEVADILEIAQGTVKRQSSDALAHLRHILGDGFSDDLGDASDLDLNPHRGGR